jgi:hypothetical protein
VNSLQNLRYRFLCTYTPLSEELHQTGENTDTCIGANYWHLLPQYIEQEMRDGPLHIYKSAFGCGYILRGVEPRPKPVVATVVLEPVEPVDKPAEPEPIRWRRQLMRKACTWLSQRSWHTTDKPRTGTGGSGWGSGPRRQIIKSMGLFFIPLYRVVGPQAMSILFLMFIWPEQRRRCRGTALNSVTVLGRN